MLLFLALCLIFAAGIAVGMFLTMLVTLVFTMEKKSYEDYTYERSRSQV
jgi:hypothetical protein